MKLILILSLLSLAGEGIAQKWTSEKSMLVFYSHAAIEDIRAENTKGSALFDTSSGNVAFIIPIKDFQFAKALMQEHFNEKYMESDRFPKATFQGKMEGFDLSLKQEQQVTAKGKLTIHGTTHDVSVPGTITVNSSILAMHAVFVVKLEDYKIAIPQLLWQNIAEQVEVTVDFSLKPQ